MFRTGAFDHDILAFRVRSFDLGVDNRLVALGSLNDDRANVGSVRFVGGYDLVRFGPPVFLDGAVGLFDNDLPAGFGRTSCLAVCFITDNNDVDLALDHFALLAVAVGDLHHFHELVRQLQRDLGLALDRFLSAVDI